MKAQLFAVSAAAAILLAAPLTAQPVSEPAVPVDRLADEYAEALQHSALVGNWGDTTMVVYADGRDDQAHATVLAGPGLSDGGQGASRRSVTLDATVNLDDASFAGGEGVFMIVWSEAAALYGQRILLSGDPVVASASASFEIIAGTFSHPRVAWGPGQWLITFREGSGASGAIRQASAGALAGPPLVSGSPLIADASSFDLTGHNDAYGLAYVTTAGIPTARIARINGVGLIEADVEIGAVAGDSVILASANESGGITGWYSPGSLFAGRPFADDFSPVDAVRPVAGIGASVSDAAVAMVGDEAWLTWLDGGVVQGRSWIRTGLGDPLELAASDASDLSSASGESAVVATWSAPTSVGSGERLDVVLREYATAFVGPERVVTLGSSPRQSIDVAVSGDTSLTVWSAQGANNDRDVFLAAVGADGFPLSDPIVVTENSANETDANLAVVGDEIIVTWLSNGTRLRARRFADLTTPTGGSAFTVCLDDDGIVGHDVTVSPFADEDFALAWVSSDGAGGADVSFRSLATGSTGIGCGSVAVAGAAATSRHPVLANDGTTVQLVYASHTALVGASFDETGIVGAPATLADPASPSEMALAPAAVAGSWHLVTARPDGVEGGSDLYFSTFSTGSAFSTDVQIPSSAGAADLWPALALVGSDGALLWLREGELQRISIEAGAPSGVVESLSATAQGGPLGAAAFDVESSALVMRESDASPIRPDERTSHRVVHGGPATIADAGGPYVGDEGDTLALDGSASTPNGEIDTFAWDVEGDSLAGERPEFVAVDDGIFVVELTVTDDDTGETDRDRSEVTIRNVPPTVTFVTAPSTSDEGDSVTFRVDWADPGLADLVTLSWDYGDGEIETGPAATLETVVHTFEEGGYDVCVTVEDKDGARETQCSRLTVANAAPSVLLGAFPPVDEGDIFEIPFTISDPGDDPLKLDFVFGDGDSRSEFDVLPPYPTSEPHVYADDRTETLSSPFEICVSATDDGGLRTEDCADLTVLNVAPILAGTPATEAVVGLDGGGDPLVYATQLTIDDPGDADWEATVDSGGLEGGVSLELEGAGPTVATVSFVPTLAHWNDDADHIYSLSLRVDDGDTDGVSTLGWPVTIVLQDDDEDGIPNACEEAYDLGDATGADDTDGDGVDNRTECVSGTDPTVDDRPPLAPTLNSPPDGTVLDTLSVILSVTNLPPAAGVEYTYHFELFRDAALLDEVDSEIAAEGDTTTQFLPIGITDRSTFYWRARARSGRFVGPWMSPASFTIMLPNADPSAPVGISPEGEVDESTPDFLWQNAEDPDSDPIVYTLEVWRDDALTDRERIVTDIPEEEGGQTAYRPPVEFPLADNAHYWWTVTAVDARDGISEPSEPLEILVNAFNDPPGTPTIVEPEDGATVTSAYPTLVVTPVEDVDSGLVTYSFVVSDDESFDILHDSAHELLPSPSDGLVRHTVTRELEENTLYYWRAAAGDSRVLGGFVQGEFFVNADNDPPPAPTWQTPGDGETVTERRPDLTIRNVTDPDGDAVTYDFEVATTVGFDEPVFDDSGVIQGSGDETTVRLTVDLVAGNYHARARGVDAFGEAGPWSTIRFDVELTLALPDPPEPFEPAFGSIVETTRPTLGALLPDVDDPSGRTAEFALYMDELLETQIYFAGGELEDDDRQAFHTVADALSDGDYFWHARVRAGDDVSPWSTTWLFTVERSTTGADAGADMGAGDAGADAGVADTGGSTDVDINEARPIEGCCSTVGGAGGSAWLLVWGLMALHGVRRRRR